MADLSRAATEWEKAMLGSGPGKVPAREMGLTYPQFTSLDDAIDHSVAVNHPVRVWVSFVCGHSDLVSRTAYKVFPSRCWRDTRVTQ